MQTPITKALAIIDECEKNAFFEIATETMRIHLQSLLPYEQECIENAVNETEKKCVIFGNKIINKFKKSGDLFYHDEDEGNIYFYQTFIK
jgi:hypothetical protein